MMSLTNEQKSELKQDLLDMKQELEASLNNENYEALKEDAGELSTVDNHLGDSASGLVNREETMAEGQLKKDQLDEVNAALKRMEEGTYGVCVDTGEPIPYERLQAIPYTRRTVKAEEAYREESGVMMDDRGSTSRLQKPKSGMEDGKSRTIEEIEENHNNIDRPGEGLTENDETPKGYEK